MNSKTFGVFHKEHKAFFAGFDAAGSPVWSAEAKRMTKAEAEAQAALFIAMQYSVQRKPVSLQ